MKTAGHWARETLRSILALIVVLAVIEAGIRATYFVRNSFVDEVVLPYAYDGDYGPVPPWLDDQRLVEPDPTLVWRGKAGVQRTYVDVFAPIANEDERTSLLRRFIPRPPAGLAASQRWEVSLNSRGYREREFATAKEPGTFRIVCIGDSWTFGANVAEPASYPAQLRKLLRERNAGEQIEVLNLGTLGYASYNGRMMLSRIRELQPDIVIIGFAMNEPTMAGYVAPSPDNGPGSRSIRERLGGIGKTVWKGSALVDLLRYAADIATWKPTSFEARLEGSVKSRMWNESLDAAVTNSEYEPWLAQSLKEYEGYLLTMIDTLVNADSRVILLQAEFWERSPYLGVMQKISAERGVPLVAGSHILARARDSIVADLENRLGLQPSSSPGATNEGKATARVVFRVHAGARSVPRALYLSGNSPQLGASVPNRLAMNDSGEGGDEKAGDNVWSYAAELPPGTPLRYVYTNSGREGVWEGLDVPITRWSRVPEAAAGRTMYLPTEVFGESIMRADPWHTNGVGYALIARALADSIGAGGMRAGRQITRN